MVDIEVGSLRALEEQLFAITHGSVKELDGVQNVWCETSTCCLVLFESDFGIFDFNAF